jgi:transcriptional regulator with XRE-family HTH domain
MEAAGESTGTEGASEKASEKASALLQAVGTRARSLRHDRHLTLDELSARSGVSRRMIALLEAGEANPSLGTLDKLARALGVDFGSLVTFHTAAPLVPGEGEGVEPVWEDGLGSSARLLVSRAGTARAELWQWELVAGGRYQGEADPPGSEEIIVVSSGDLVVEVGGQHLELGDGGYLRLPSDRPYAYVNAGPAPARFVRVFLAS